MMLILTGLGIWDNYLDEPLFPEQIPKTTKATGYDRLL
jgi:hypothetical protein